MAARYSTKPPIVPPRILSSASRRSHRDRQTTARSTAHESPAARPPPPEPSSKHLFPLHLKPFSCTPQGPVQRQNGPKSKPSTLNSIPCCCPRIRPNTKTCCNRQFLG